MGYQPFSTDKNANNYTIKPRTVEPPSTPPKLRYPIQNNLPLTPPFLQNNFQLLKLLDESIAKKQYLAKNIHTNEQVQMDILYISNIDSWDTIENFRKTTQILQDLNIKTIPKVLDFIDASSAPEPLLIRISEYHEAETLESFLNKEKRFSIDEFRKITFSLLETLNKLHTFTPPIIHRNIKPSSILITKDNQLLLTNFENVLSSYDSYMDPDNDKGFYAPEHLTGNTVPESDYFSVGATMLTLITRKPPHSILKNIYQNDSIKSTQIKLEKLLEDNLPTHFKPFKKTLLTLLDPIPKNRVLLPQKENSAHNKNTQNKTLSSKPATSIQNLTFAGQIGSYQYFLDLPDETPRQIPENYKKKWTTNSKIQLLIPFFFIWIVSVPNLFYYFFYFLNTSPNGLSTLSILGWILFLLFWVSTPFFAYFFIQKQKYNDYRYKLIQKGEKADAQVEYSPDDDCYYYTFKTLNGDFVKEKFFLPENTKAPETIGILYDPNKPLLHTIYPFPPITNA